MNTLRSLWWTGLIVAVGVGAAGCGHDEAKPNQPTIAATIWPMASLTRQLVGDDVTVVCLLPPGLSPHSFEPTAQQMQDLAGAKMLVAVGLGLDHWAWNAAKATGRGDLPMFVFADAVGIVGDHAAAHDEDEHDANAHATDAVVQVGVNQHLWLDPALVGRMLPKLAAELEKALPDHQAVIKANLAKLLADVQQLDAEYREQLSKAPVKAIVTFHDAFNRMAERYGLTVAATLMPIETPGGVSSQRIEQVVDAVSRYRLKVVFAEPQFSPEAANTLAAETHIRVMTLDPLGDRHVPERDTYQKMMRYNLKTLVEGLGTQ
ncbi:MAG: metal ABC transporter substrate-binding protein [Phycisphaerales bacterium]